MAGTGTFGPDVVIAGAARSGTSFIASWLGSHPDIDPGAVKESNFFSRELERGFAWYDSLYEPRRPGLLRLDASMSYTFPHFPNALKELVAEAPNAVVVYAVRHPIRRLLSHYQLHRDYFGNEHAQTLGEALGSSGRFADVYTGASDYGFWLPRLAEQVEPANLIVVPFPVITKAREQLLGPLCSATGLDPTPLQEAVAGADRHRNEVVQFRSGGVRTLRRAVRRAGLYPTVRRALGADRIRGLRSILTRQAQTEDMATALTTCTPSQLADLQDLYDTARNAASEALALQDSKLGLQWAREWELECPELDASAEARW